MANSKLNEKELTRKINDYEKKVSWHLLLVFIISGILAYQVIFNVIFLDVLYNPALGDLAVEMIPAQTNDMDEEPKVIAWTEEKNEALRTIDGIPTVLGIQIPQFYFVCIMVALGLILFNIRSYSLKRFIQALEDELHMSN